jgi:hypothetical protein
MSSNSNTFRVSNEQLALIDILNGMYNDNLRQIDNIMNTLNSLNESNNQIRNLLVRLIEPNNTSRQQFTETRYRSNIGRRENSRPYVIDSVMEYTVPLRSINNAGINNHIPSLESLLQIMQPVEVYPTQTQIEAATRRVQYCNISRPINSQCPISMDDFMDTDIVTIIRPCGHIFHTEQLMNWFRSNCRCPVCRYDIRDYTSNASTGFFSNTPYNTNTNTNTLLDTRIEPVDSSNNIAERTYINRTDSSFANSYNDFNDAYLNSLVDLTDASGNYLDNIIGTTTLAELLLNAMNRSRNR